MLSLIRAHALLHQASRERDPRGRVVATFDDYDVVRELVVDIVSEAVEATVPTTVRETVNVVANETEPLSIARLAELLNLDKSAASRRWQNARARGYLRNLEDSRGKPARIVLGEPLPENVEILPSLQRLIDRTMGVPDVRAPTNPRLLPGDAGYLHDLSVARAKGHVTEGEWEQLKLVHQTPARRAR